MLYKCLALVTTHHRCLPQGIYWHTNICPSSAASSAGETPAAHCTHTALHTQLLTDVPVLGGGAPSLLPFLLHSLLASTKLPPGPAHFKAFASSKDVAQRGSALAVSCWEQEGGSCNQLPFVPLAGAQRGFPTLAQCAAQERLAGASCACPRPQHTRAGRGSPSAVTPWGRADCASPWSSARKQKCSSSQGLPASRCQGLPGSSPAGITSPRSPQKEPDAQLPGAGSTAQGWTGPGNSPRQTQGRRGKAVPRDGLC